jgi:hypothetical protein
VRNWELSICIKLFLALWVQTTFLFRVKQSCNLISPQIMLNCHRKRIWAQIKEQIVLRVNVDSRKAERWLFQQFILKLLLTLTKTTNTQSSLGDRDSIDGSIFSFFLISRYNNYRRKHFNYKIFRIRKSIVWWNFNFKISFRSLKIARKLQFDRGKPLLLFPMLNSKFFRRFERCIISTTYLPSTVVLNLFKAATPLNSKILMATHTNKTIRLKSPKGSTVEFV